MILCKTSKPGLTLAASVLKLFTHQSSAKPILNLLPTSRNMSNQAGITLAETVTRLERFAPKFLAESWDNVGLLLEPAESKNVETILLTNDLTEDVTDEALTLGAQLIISYHPPLFKPIKTITNKHWKTRIISKCLANHVAVYSPHTCYDAVYGGVNDWLANAFDFTIKYPITLSPLPPEPIKSDINLAECGAGRTFTLKKKITVNEAVERIKSHLGIKHVHLALARNSTKESLIESVALCAGSGGSVLANVNADLLLTGEMSHHEVLEAVHRGSHVILTWHSSSERGFLPHLAELLKSKVIGPEVKIHVSKSDVEPIETV